MEISQSFAPIAGEDACVLILGSMPGRASLARQQYYAHPRNAFWPIMSRLLAFHPEMDYPQCIQRLVLNRIAVWDVLQSGYRPGSLDAKIYGDSVRVNNFVAFFTDHPHIKRVCFNGKTAESYFKKRVMPDLTTHPYPTEYRYLPSTSPALAALNFEQKLAIWKSIKHYLDDYERTI